MAIQILSQFIPTTEQIANWQHVSTLLLGVFAVLLAVTWVIDRVLDQFTERGK